jgi:hypothetical protein
MKKLALTNLIVLIAIKSVSACSYVPGKAPASVFEGKEIYFWTMFIGSFVLLGPVVILYFLRNRRGLWTVIMSISSLALLFPAIAAAGFLSICGTGAPVAAVIIAEFFLMFLLFIYQLYSWISQKKLSINLR